MQFASASERFEYAHSAHTPEVEYLHAKTIAETNQCVLDERFRHARQFQFASNDKRGYSANYRFWYFLNLQTNFANKEFSKFRKHNGILHQTLFDTHVIIYRKADLPGSPLPIAALFEKYHFYDLPLIYDTTDEPPIENLFPLTARMIIGEKDTMSEFYYNDQQGKSVMSSVPLDLSLYRLSTQFDEPKSPPSNPFSWKGDSDDKSDLG